MERTPRAVQTPQGDELRQEIGYRTTPKPVRAEDELRRMNMGQLAAEAVRWGVTADTPAMTRARILDAQAGWRLGQMSDKSLWDAVREMGLRAGSREQNIATLMAAAGIPPDRGSATPDRAAPRSPQGEPIPETATDTSAGAIAPPAQTSGDENTPETQPGAEQRPLGQGEGWKLHLAVDPENQDAVEQALTGMGLPFKRGRNGEQVGKDFTVYVGPKDQARAAADAINQHLGDLLAEPRGDAVENDASFGGRVMGRFDVRDADVHQYGRGGVPDLNADVQNRVFGGDFNPDEATRRADDVLRQRYGDAYAGEQQNNPTPPDEPAAVDRTAEGPSQPPAPDSAARGMTVEPYGAGLVVVRGADATPRSLFGPDGLGGRYNEKAGGWLFPKRRAQELADQVRAIGGERGGAEGGSTGEVPAAAGDRPSPFDDTIAELQARVQKHEAIAYQPMQTPGPLATGRDNYTMGKRLDAENNRKADAFRKAQAARAQLDELTRRRDAWQRGEVHENGQPRADAPSRQQAASADATLAEFLRDTIKPGDTVYAGGSSPIGVRRVSAKSITSDGGVKWSYDEITPAHPEGRPMTSREVVDAYKTWKEGKQAAPAAAIPEPTTPPIKTAGLSKIRERKQPVSEPSAADDLTSQDMPHAPLAELKRQRDAAIKAVFEAGLTKDMDRPKQYSRYPDEQRQILVAYDKAQGDYSRAIDAASPEERATITMFERKPGGSAPDAPRVEYEGRRRSKEAPAEPLKGKDEPPPAEIRRQVADALFGPQSFVGADVKPTIEKAGQAIMEAATGLQRVLAPQTRGPDAKLAKGAIREFNADLARKMDRAMEATAKARWYFEGQKRPANYDFIDRMERGEDQATPQLTRFARTLRDLLDQGRRDVQRLGQGKLQHFIEDYFPHIWKDPDAAKAMIGRILGRRPMEGTKSFLKKRSVDLMSTGIKAGLEPISDNPVDLALLKYREMQRYVFAHQVLADLKAQDVLQYVPAHSKPPDGYTKINDPVATVYGKPTVTVKEYVDRVVYEGLEKLAADLGIEHARLPNAGRGALGFSVQGGNRVVTQFGTGEATYAHEIGHQLDVKYGMYDRFFNNPDPKLRAQMKRELRALADLKTATWDNPAGGQSDVHRQRAEQLAHITEAYVHARERMHEVAPDVYLEFERMLYQHPELRQVRDIQNSISKLELTNEVPHGGMLIMGAYHAPDAAANVINNHLSPGLRNRSGVMRAFMGAANFYNGVQLGLSAFHLGMTSIDASTSKLALALEQAVAGRPVNAAKLLTQIPVAPVENALRGRQVMHAWLGDSYEPGAVERIAGKYLLDPLTRLTGAGLGREELAKIVDAVVAGGGRAKMDDFYRTGITTKMLDAFRKGNVAGGLLRATLAPFDIAAKPILEYIVPRQKLGVFADMARAEMDKLGPDADRTAVREAMAKAWDSVDNRMGQVVYDNLFWNRTAKDLAMLSVRSVGWNLGTLRELGGGVLDFGKNAAKAAALGKLGKPELTHRMAYTLAVPVVAGAVGALLQYALTGKGPGQLLDYFYPRTGRTDEDGNEQRISLPTYMKDVVSYAKHPLETLKHKVHPSIDLITSMLENKDFYGTKVYNEDDPWVRRQLDKLKFAGKSLTPFGVEGYQRVSAEDLPGARKVLPFVGFAPAPKSLTASPAEEAAQEIMAGKGEVGGRTTEQADRAQFKRDMAKRIKAGGESAQAARRELGQAVASGKISREDFDGINRRASMTPLQWHVRGMDAVEALKVYRLADAQERAEIRDVVRSHVRDSKDPRIPTAKKGSIMGAVSRGEDLPAGL